MHGREMAWRRQAKRLHDFADILHMALDNVRHEPVDDSDAVIMGCMDRRPCVIVEKLLEIPR
jgi:hypothetical protein